MDGSQSRSAKIAQKIEILAAMRETHEPPFRINTD
jgi:hypothetical protein